MRILTACVCACLFPLTALAQGGQPAPAPGGQGGPMIVERVKSGFVYAPDVKVTKFDRRVTELVGGYAGWLTDRTFFIGGGGYFTPNHTRDRRLAYGGLVVGLQTGGSRRVGVGVKGLVGGGQATVVRSVTLFDRDDFVHIQNVVSNLTPNLPHVPTRIVAPVPVVASARVRERFFVGEPEANVIVNLTKRFRLTAGAGYRFVASRNRGTREDLGGVTGSVALQIGAGGS